jgi:hypothetical protein
VTPLEQADSVEVKAAVERSIAEKNERTRQSVAPMLEHLASADYYRMAVPTKWLAGSFTTSGFINLTNEPGTPDVLLGFGALHESPAGDTLEFQNTTVIAAASTPCSDAPARIIAVPISSLTEANGRFTTKSAELTFTNLPATIVTAADQKWLCPGAQSHARAVFGRYERIGDGRYIQVSGH